ncbi:hypothetical protein [Kitasatospora sp. NPDC001095]
MVDLTSTRSTAAHLAAKPSVQIAPAERLRPPPVKDLPRICRKPTITVRPGDLGKIDKLRQDRPYLSPAWHDAYKLMRAHNESVNGRAKGHHINIADPKKRLAHGRVAQAILLALMILMINLLTIQDWFCTTSPELTTTHTVEDYDDLTPPPRSSTAFPHRPADEQLTEALKRLASHSRWPAARRRLPHAHPSPTAPRAAERSHDLRHEAPSPSHAASNRPTKSRSPAQPNRPSGTS